MGVNELRTVNIKGKEYVEVPERIRYFRESDAFVGYSLISEWLELTEKRAICLAKILNPSGVIVATGTAYELADSSFINKTSYIENCETSAWGRALGNLGIGVETSVASALEVANAIQNQNKKETPIQQKPQQINTISKEQATGIVAYAKECKVDLNVMMQNYGISRLGELSISNYEKFMNDIKRSKS